MRSLLLIASALLMLGTSASAQSGCSIPSGSSSIICTRTNLHLFTVSVVSSVSAASTNYSLAPSEGTVPGSAYEQGFFVPAQPLALTLQTNAPANIYLRATGSTFTGSSSICTGKAISTASVSSSANGTFTNLTTSTPGVLVHQQTEATAGLAVHVHFRIGLSWSTDRPTTSACGLPLQLTLRTN